MLGGNYHAPLVRDLLKKVLTCSAQARLNHKCNRSRLFFLLRDNGQPCSLLDAAIPQDLRPDASFKHCDNGAQLEANSRFLREK